MADPRNARLLRKYNITAEEYDRMLESQGGKCAICGKPPKNVRLSVDHDHAVERTKVEAKKLFGKWVAFVPHKTLLEATSSLRSKAVRAVKLLLKRFSVRGLLCPWCNRGLRFYHDNPDLLRNAAQYLENYKNGKGSQEILTA